jgi:ABC-type transport system involved in multi-copper enzyme maturation permease subunit
MNTVDIHHGGHTVSAHSTHSAHSAPSGLAVLGAAVRAEWTKMRSVRSTVWTLLAAIAVAIGFGSLVAVSQMNAWDTLTPVEQARFDATWLSLSGLFLAQLAMGVLGVMMITSEYVTGQIRSTLAATPQRLTMLFGKVISFVGVVLVAGLVITVTSFATGQAILSSEGLDASITEPGVARAVIGGALYLTTVGVLGLGIGTIVRRTAGAITTLVTVLLVVPIVSGLLPSAWNEHFGKYLPARAGMAIINVVPESGSLTPWTGLAVLVAYAVAALALGAALMHRRDA